MKINNLMSLALILSGFTIANSAHAMLMQRAMNRSGTKYMVQLAQNTQRRWLETESKKVSQMSPEERIANSLETIANELKKNNTNIESLVKKVDALERIEVLMLNITKSYAHFERSGYQGKWDWLFKK